LPCLINPKTDPPTSGPARTQTDNKQLPPQSSYTFSFQQGVLESTTPEAARGDENIHHNIFSLSLIVTYPYRID
jgi:hypothetical protein